MSQGEIDKLEIYSITVVMLYSSTNRIMILTLKPHETNKNDDRQNVGKGKQKYYLSFDISASLFKAFSQNCLEKANAGKLNCKMAIKVISTRSMGSNFCRTLLNPPCNSFFLKYACKSRKE